ncbi:MAG: YggS family pyridoxal phosphate-dependent enzyme [Flavobacteriaceae bacterium]
MSLKDNLESILKSIPNDVTLVAVSKTKPIRMIQELYNAGHRVFGENKVQEMCAKFEELPKDISWHMIGHLQRNKIKYMAHFVDLIHGVDSIKTLKEINKQAKKHNRIIRCLLQVKIASEDSKFGLSFNETKSILANSDLKALANIKICGLMGMASFTTDETQIAREFKSLNVFFNDVKSENTNNIILETLSMGMSGDYTIAIDNGSTLVRVGSAIFGKRNIFTI